MSALDKVLALSRPAEPAEDPAAALVLSLSATLSELRVCLAKSDPDNDGDDDSSAKGDTDHDYFSKGGKKKSPGKASSSKSPPGKGDDSDDGDDDETAAAVAKLVKKGVPLAKAKAMVQQRVKASALAESACVILSRLVDGDPAPEPDQTYLGRVVALAAVAPKMDAHQLHVAHVKHVEHVAHQHVEHLAHLAHMAHIGK